MQRQSSSIDKESPSKSSDAISDIASPLRKDLEAKTYAGAKYEEELISFKSEIASLGTSQVSESSSYVDDNTKSPDSLESKDLLNESRSPDPSTDPLGSVSGHSEPENVEAIPSTGASKSLPTRTKFENLPTSLQSENESILVPVLADLRTETLTTEKATQLFRFPYGLPRFEAEIESIRRFWEEFYIPKPEGFDETYAAGEPKKSDKKGKSVREILASPSKLFKRREEPSPRKLKIEIEEESGAEPTESSQCQSAGGTSPSAAGIRKILASPSKLFKRRESASARKLKAEIEPESGPEPTESSQCQSAGGASPSAAGIRKILASPSKLFKRRKSSSPRKVEIELESGPEPTESSQCQPAGVENLREDMKIPRYLYHINTEVRQMLLSSSEAAERIMRYVFLSSPEAYLPQILKYMTDYQSMEQEFVRLRIQCNELLIKIRAEQFCRIRRKTSPDQSEEGQEVTVPVEQEETVPFLADKFKLAKTFLGQVLKFLALLQNLSKELNGSKSNK